MTEVARFELTPHPVEFEMYYSLRSCEVSTITKGALRGAFCFAHLPEAEVAIRGLTERLE